MQSSARGWRRAFDEPIVLPRGQKLVTLHGAATYITKLPKEESASPEWQGAIKALMLVAEYGGPTMMARIGIMRALNRRGSPNKSWLKLSFAVSEAPPCGRPAKARWHGDSKDFPFAASHRHHPRTINRPQPKRAG